MNKKPKIIFSDFDGTLTKQGNFSPVFFDVLDIVCQQKLKFIVVTGRPLSWSHFLMSHLPLDACITEGGGMLSVKKEGGFGDYCLVPKEDLNYLQSVTAELLKKFSNLDLTEDSMCRVSDRAIDLKNLEKENLLEEVQEFLESKKVSYSCSNVHLNYWIGDFSKATSIDYYLNNFSEVSVDDCLYFGDSLNDESAFGLIKHSVGVSNISKVLEKLETTPDIILEGKKNEEIEGVFNYLKSLF